MDRLGKSARNLGKNLSIGVSLPLATFGTLAVKTAASFETIRTSLITATGSTEKANAAFAQLQNFAATTPFGLEEVAQTLEVSLATVNRDLRFARAWMKERLT